MFTHNPHNKYNNHRTMIDGITFASHKEALHYIDLKNRMAAGTVKAVQVHPRFMLQDGFKKNGRTFRPLYYEADFLVTYPDGRQEIEDVKGGVITDVFKIKQKLFEHRYPHLTIKLVTAVKGCKA